MWSWCLILADVTFVLQPWTVDPWVSQRTCTWVVFPLQQQLLTARIIPLIGSFLSTDPLLFYMGLLRYSRVLHLTLKSLRKPIATSSVYPTP